MIRGISDGDLIEAEGLPPLTAVDAAGVMFRRGIDFMIHKPVPENQHFVHVKSNGSVNPDYYRRIKIYSDFAAPLQTGDSDAELEQIDKTLHGRSFAAGRDSTPGGEYRRNKIHPRPD